MNLSPEQLQEKKLHLENELKKLQLDLVEILNQNDLLTFYNKEKDDIILNKEKKLYEIKDKNILDFEQLKTERICMIDGYEHEIEILNDARIKVELLRDRYQQLESENELIQNSLVKLREKMSVESRQHAKVVHEINASTRIMREQMEATFRKELIEMDLIFQRQAFSSMDDSKKKALLANSKLKDELALQSVGISNLTVRCQRDKQNQKFVQNEMKLLSQKIEGLRQKLSSLQLKKANTFFDISTLENEVKLSQEKEKITINDLKKWPEQENLLDGFEEITECYNETKHELRLWYQRHRQLKQLYSDMKSINASNTTLMRSVSSSIYVKQNSQSNQNTERNNNINTTTNSNSNNNISFSPPPLESSSSSPPPPLSPSSLSPHFSSNSPTSRSPHRPKYQSSQSFSENLALQLSLHPDLKTAFLPLVGRESTLLPPTSTVAECVRQVLSILQKGNFKKKFKFDEKNNNRQGSDDDNSLVSSVALSENDQTRFKDRFDGPFSNSTKQLLRLIPSLKRAVFWNSEYLESISPLKKNSIPFFDDSEGEENAGEEERESEGGKEGGGQGALQSQPPTQLDLIQEHENQKRSSSSPGAGPGPGPGPSSGQGALASASVDEILQSSWLKKYKTILSDDLLTDGPDDNGKTPSLSRAPSIFPPLSSVKSNPQSNPHSHSHSQQRQQQQQQQEAFPIHSSSLQSAQSLSDLYSINNKNNKHSNSNSSKHGIGLLKSIKKSPNDPLHSTAGHKKMMTPARSSQSIGSSKHQFTKTSSSSYSLSKL